MDRAYCVSLQREVEVSEAGELYRQGLIEGRGDFACLDPECRAGYVCVNLGKSKFKISPHFKTAINSVRGHIAGCAYEVECKNPVEIKTGRSRRPRHSMRDDAEIVFESTRPKNYFTVPAKLNVVGIDATKLLRYIPSGFSETKSAAANQKCYSVESLLNGGWRNNQRLVLDGHDGTVKSVLVPIDNNMPDMYRRYIYCGLAKSIVSDDECYMFRFGRSFGVRGRLVDVYVKVALPTINASLETKSPYYRGLIDRVITVARNAEKYPNNPFFLYVLGCPKFSKALNGYIFDVDNLDHFYIESYCSRSHLISPKYSDWEVNQHYFVGGLGASQ
ncbi:hypothetical protein [Pseudomonas lurida]|uniref:hypothetical protein n=1 Tax=Pseudomonas lurida TaxID=244566 RepID=UPI00118524B7|nr:hypothetical protein [Pseudomonas lurida]